jgi:hypothetical protein
MESNNKLLGFKTIFEYELSDDYSIQLSLFVYKSGKIAINQLVALNIGHLFNIKKNYDTKFLTKISEFLNKQIVIEGKEK